MVIHVATYHYQALNKQEELQIRLLTIQPGTTESPIHCSLKLSLLDHANHDDQSTRTLTENYAHFSSVFHPQVAGFKLPAYEALSYTWGDDDSKLGITVDGQYLGVNSNLHNALRHLRYHDRPRTIWVDAVCLNQNDETEKQHQIPIMHLIYAQAVRVVVWLGAHSSDSDLAMQYVRDLYATVEPGKEGEISDTNHHSKWPVTLLSRAPLWKAQTDCWFAFYRLLARNWFKRAWIVQEIAFARDAVILCGSTSVTWSQLRIGLHLTRINHVFTMQNTDIASDGQTLDGHPSRTWPAQVINNVLGLLYDTERVRRLRPEQTQSFVTELSWCIGINKARLCTKPQDRTYSVLGIAGGKFRTTVRTDYNQTLEQHCRDIVRYFFESTGSLDVILHAQHMAWLVSGSSWAPDWSQPERAAVLHQNEQGFFYPIPPTQHGDVLFPPNTATMQVKGNFLGRITSTGLEFDKILKPDQPYYDMASAINSGTNIPPNSRRWWECREAEVGYLFDAILPLLPAASFLWKRHLELFLQTLAVTWYPDALAFFQCQWEIDECLQSPQHFARFEGMNEFWNLLIYLLASRTVCSVRDGRLVVAPDFIQPEDDLVLLLGCSCPVILRKQKDGTYRLVGEAYALGLDPNTETLAGPVNIVLT